MYNYHNLLYSNSTHFPKKKNLLHLVTGVELLAIIFITDAINSIQAVLSNRVVCDANRSEPWKDSDLDSQEWRAKRRLELIKNRRKLY